jgi:hypothetical protein
MLNLPQAGFALASRYVSLKTLRIVLSVELLQLLVPRCDSAGRKG